MKVAIIGPDTIGANIELTQKPTLIITGGRKGVEACARHYSRKNNIPLLEINPDIRRYGNTAPLLHSRKIAETADIIYAYTDGSCPDTKQIIDYARKINKPVQVYAPPIVSNGTLF